MWVANILTSSYKSANSISVVEKIIKVTQKWQQILKELAHLQLRINTTFLEILCNCHLKLLNLKTPVRNGCMNERKKLAKKKLSTFVHFLLDQNRQWLPETAQTRLFKSLSHNTRTHTHTTWPVCVCCRLMLCVSGSAFDQTPLCHH